jgi:hypothetical protein
MRFTDVAQAAVKAFASFQGGSTFDGQAPVRVAEQLGQWVTHFSKNAAASWVPAILNPCMCSFCDEDAVTDCIACKDPICMAHGHISFRAEGLCDECVEKAVSAHGPKQKKTRTGTREKPSRRPSVSSDLANAFATLGVASSATWPEVQAAYKALALANHPDRFPEGTKKREAENVLRSCNAAFSLLKTHFERAA